jgi:hypothetical protein
VFAESQLVVVAIPRYRRRDQDYPDTPSVTTRKGNYLAHIVDRVVAWLALVDVAAHRVEAGVNGVQALDQQLFSGEIVRQGLL